MIGADARPGAPADLPQANASQRLRQRARRERARLPHLYNTEEDVDRSSRFWSRSPVEAICRGQDLCISRTSASQWSAFSRTRAEMLTS